MNVSKRIKKANVCIQSDVIVVESFKITIRHIHRNERYQIHKSIQVIYLILCQSRQKILLFREKEARYLPVIIDRMTDAFSNFVTTVEYNIDDYIQHSYWH